MNDTLVTELVVCRLTELADPDCREFRVGGGDWPFKGFVVRKGAQVFAYQNHCVHAGHPLNWRPHDFLTADGSQIICASHGAIYEIDSGRCTAGPCRGKSLRPVVVSVSNGDVIVRVSASSDGRIMLPGERRC